MCSVLTSGSLRVLAMLKPPQEALAVAAAVVLATNVLRGH